MPDERIELPNGQVVLYHDGQHRYHAPRENGKRGEHLHGVSSIGKSFDLNPDPLLGWAAGLAIDGVVQLFGNRQLPNDPDVVKAAIRAEQLTWRDIRNQAATRGTNVHRKALEALASGEGLSHAGLTDDEIGYAEAVEDWWHDRKPEVLQCEQVVCGLPDYKFAGRFDLRCLIDGKVCLVDLKTSKSVSAGYHVQIAGYDLGAELSDIGPSERLVILQVRPDGSYEEHEGLCTREGFLVAFENYCRAKAVQKILDGNYWRKRAEAEAA